MSSRFSDGEIEYLKGQHIGRLATVDADGQPHVVPVGFRFNEVSSTFDVGGPFLSHSKKYRNAARDERVTFLIDDMLPPMQPRGIEIRGRAEIVSTGGTEIHPDFDPELIRISPTRAVSWGIDPGGFGPSPPADPS